jgi:hypothetical protein
MDDEERTGQMPTETETTPPEPAPAARTASEPTASESTAAGSEPAAVMPGEPGQPARSRRSGLVGVLAVVPVIMGVGMLVAQIVSSAYGRPGPGALAVGAHLAGAVVGVGCYQVAIRRRGLVRVAALVVLPLVIVGLLWFFWLAS